MVKLVDTKGITYLNPFPGCPCWYWGTDYKSGDLSEAAYAVIEGHSFEANRLVFVHYPEGMVYEPVTAKEFQYLGEPSLVDGAILFPFADFEKSTIYIYQWDANERKEKLILELSLEDDFFKGHMMIVGSPMMIAVQMLNKYRILWPENREYEISESEYFFVRDKECLYFSTERENECGEYWNEVIVRDYATGKIIDRFKGTLTLMDDGQIWILQ